MDISTTPQTKRTNGKKTPTKRGKESRMESASFNSEYLREDFKLQFSTAFKNKDHYKNDSNGVTMYNEPFQCCVLPNFVTEENFLKKLKNELSDQIFYQKNNDLYKFQQSNDLRKIHTPHINGLRKLLYEDFLGWLRETTGIPFTDKMDLTCSRYEATDVLLCHDDELEGRRIAFILYLVPPWKKEDGGTLDLFSMDDNNQPKDITRSIVPAWNNLVFFEVSPASFHQVSEILTEDKTRLSIGGWFHGPTLPRPPRYIEPPKPLCTHVEVEEEFVYDWINPIYLDIEVQSQIQEKFEAASEIHLQGFLKDEKYQELLKALKSPEVQWLRRGPVIKRNYEHAKEEQLPEILQKCITFLKSEPLFLILSNLTGLSLHELATQSDSEAEESQTSEQKAGNESGSDSEQKSRRIKRRKLELDSADDLDDKCKAKSKGKGTSNEDLTEKAADPGVSKAESKLGNPRCHVELRRWSHGSYTLVHDDDMENAEFTLDAMLFCNCNGWQQEYGGFTSYITKGEDEELLTVNPLENSLALVYRDKDTLRFVKHVNHKIEEMSDGNELFDLSAVYYE